MEKENAPVGVDYSSYTTTGSAEPGLRAIQAKTASSDVVSKRSGTRKPFGSVNSSSVLTGRSDGISSSNQKEANKSRSSVTEQENTKSRGAGVGVGGGKLQGSGLSMLAAKGSSALAKVSSAFYVKGNDASSTSAEGVVKVKGLSVRPINAAHFGHLHDTKKMTVEAPVLGNVKKLVVRGGRAADQSTGGAGQVKIGGSFEDIEICRTGKTSSTDCAIPDSPIERCTRPATNDTEDEFHDLWPVEERPTSFLPQILRWSSFMPFMSQFDPCSPLRCDDWPANAGPTSPERDSTTTLRYNADKDEETVMESFELPPLPSLEHLDDLLVQAEDEGYKDKRGGEDSEGYAAENKSREDEEDFEFFSRLQ